MKHRGLCSERSHGRAKPERAALRARARQRGKQSARMRRNLLKIFSPVPSSRFPPGKHDCINSLHHQVRGGNEWQGLKSTCFWQSSLRHRANHLSLAPRPGSRRYFCWRRQNKSPRASLGIGGGGNKNNFNSLGGKEKKKVLKIKLEDPERDSAPSLPCARPSPRLPQQNVHKHILWPGRFICCQGDKANSCRLSGLGAGAAPGARQRWPRPGPGRVGKHGGSHAPHAARGRGGPATVPQRHRAVRGEGRTVVGPEIWAQCQTITPSDGLWGKAMRTRTLPGMLVRVIGGK